MFTPNFRISIFSILNKLNREDNNALIQAISSECARAYEQGKLEGRPQLKQLGWRMKYTRTKDQCRLYRNLCIMGKKDVAITEFRNDGAVRLQAWQYVWPTIEASTNAIEELLLTQEE